MVKRFLNKQNKKISAGGKTENLKFEIFQISKLA